jgi:DHA1 family multidrug resistance protein-like MFS transporter
MVADKTTRRAYFLIFTIFIGGAGTYAVMPFLAIQMSRAAHLSPSLIGALLATSIVIARGLMLISGALSDRLGPKRFLLSGTMLIGASYAGFALSRTLVLVVLSVLVNAIGVALFQPSSKSLLFACTSSGRWQNIFAWRAAAFSAGVALGAGLGGALSQDFSFQQIFLLASYLYAALVPFLWLFVLPATPPYQQAAPFPWQGIYDALRNRQLLALTAVVAAFWILYAQFTITVPLAFAAMNRTQALGLVFVLNAVLVAVGQVPILQMVNRMSKNVNQQLAAGLVLVGLGLGSIALTFPSWISAIVLSVLLSLGEMLVVPNLDLSAGKLAKNGLTGTYFGVTSLGWMVGGGVGGVFGGAVLQFGQSHSVPSLLWLVCAGFATMVAMVVYIGLQWLV